LLGANLSDANLSGARLLEAGLGRAVLDRAVLLDADLTGASLSEASCAGVDARRARMGSARCRGLVLRGANLGGAYLKGAELDGSDVSGASFDGADLRGATLRRVVGFRRANWLGVDIREIDFTGAYLCRRFIVDQNYIAEFRRQGPCAEVVYRVWRLTSDCGRSMLRWAISTGAIVVVFAWIYTFVALDYGEYETRLSPIYYSVVTLTTLGYGDVHPASAPAQVVAMLQVILGYVMLGGLLSIISNKMVRRAD
jgi:hypothetical protein